MIEVKNVSKTYGKRFAVNDISFSVEKGEILGFLGPNGAGKTTTMRMLTGYFSPSAGTIKIAGFDILEHPELVKAKIGYLPEHPPLYQDMKVFSYLEYVAKLKNVDKTKRKAQVKKVMELCGIEDVAKRLISNLSKGYKQRVGIAQALINDPEILILDEPTVGLDPKQIIEIRNLIKSLAGSRTIILSSHILPEITMTSTRVAIINNGKIVAFDTTEDLAKKVNNNTSFILKLKDLKQNYIDAIKSLDSVLELSQNTDKITITTKKDLELGPELIKLLVDKGAEILEFKKEELSLETVFLKLTTEEQL